MKRATEILFIGTTGESAAIILSNVNQVLECIVLTLTVAGLIWKVFKSDKNKKPDS